MSGPARPNVPTDEPMFIQDEQGAKEEEEETQQPPIFRSSSGPAKPAEPPAPKDEDEDEDTEEQPDIRRCASGPAGHNDPVKVPLPKHPKSKKAAGKASNNRGRSDDTG